MAAAWTFDRAIIVAGLSFVEAVRGRRTKPEVDGWEGLRSLALCQAGYEPAASGAPVQVDDVVSGAVVAYQKPIDDYWDL